jgi:hypothetical protein
MPTPDRYGQGVQYTALGDSPNLEWLGDQLANGILPRALLTFDSANHRASVLTGERAPSLSKVPYLTYLKDTKTVEIWINGGWVRMLYDTRRFAYKPGPTQRPATVSATPDPHLTLAVEANSVYTLTGMLFYDGDDGGDLKFGFTAPAGSTGSWWPGAPDSSMNALAFAPRWGAITDVTASTMAAGTIGTGNTLAASPSGLVITGSTAGHLTLVWGQNTANAAPTTLRAHSWLRLERM